MYKDVRGAWMFVCIYIYRHYSLALYFGTIGTIRSVSIVISFVFYYPLVLLLSQDIFNMLTPLIRNVFFFYDAYFYDASIVIFFIPISS